MLAARVKPQLEEEGRARMRAAGAKSAPGRPAAKKGFADLPNLSPEFTKPSTPEPWDSTAQSAAMFNVSPRLVTDASKVLAESPEDAHRIESGELTVHAARTKGHPFGGYPRAGGRRVTRLQRVTSGPP
jgi:hypothetical protein